MSPDPLRVTVISAEHIGHLPDIPIVSRTFIPPALAHVSYILDELRSDTDFWTSAWRQNFMGQLQNTAVDNKVGYVVPGHPMLGDATMEFLLAEDRDGRIDLELYDEPLPVILTEVLSISFGSPAFVDALALIEIDRHAPFNGGMSPVHSSQAVIVTNVIPGSIGADLERILGRHYRPDTGVRLIPMVGEPEQAELALEELGNEVSGYPSYLVVPPATGDSFQRTPNDLQRIVARLRAPGGCSWDRAQSNTSLSRNLIEESYELLDAIESGKTRAIREELGDFLLQAVMHAQITEDAGSFTLEDVIDTLIEKLVRRHPHVFQHATADDADAVLQTWDDIKKSERAAKPSRETPGPLGDIPNSLPSLMRAQSVIKRASRTSYTAQQIEQFNESAHHVFQTEDERRIVAQILQAAHSAQELGVDAEHAVRTWTLGFERAVAEASDED